MPPGLKPPLVFHRKKHENNKTPPAFLRNQFERTRICKFKRARGRRPRAPKGIQGHPKCNFCDSLAGGDICLAAEKHRCSYPPLPAASHTLRPNLAFAPRQKFTLQKCECNTGANCGDDTLALRKAWKYVNRLLHLKRLAMPKAQPPARQPARCDLLF